MNLFEMHTFLQKNLCLFIIQMGIKQMGISTASITNRCKA